MNTIKNGWMAAALVALAAVAAVPARAFTHAERGVARTVAEEAKSRMDGAAGLGGRAVTLLPVHGDTDAYLESLLLDAGVQAGLKMVVANDTSDARFKRILREIRWDEDQKRLETVDPETIDELGHLLSTQVLLEGRLATSRRPVKKSRSGRAVGPAGEDGEGLVEMELQLFAYEIATKRYVWSANVSAAEAPEETGEPGAKRGVSDSGPYALEEPCPLNVGIQVTAAEGAERVADELETWLRGRLADQGYRVDTGKDDDLVLEAEVEAARYDRTGEWETWKGAMKVSAGLCGAGERLLGTANFPAKGKPGVEIAGQRNLAYEMEAQLAPWLKRTLDPDAVPCEAIRLELELADAIEISSDYKLLEKIRTAISGMDGVRSVRLAGQDNAAGKVAYKVVYDPEAYPGGFANALFAAHPELLDKYLK